VRVLIAEDDALLREGLALLLRAESHEVVGAVGTAEDFLVVLDQASPDIAVVDVRMPPTWSDEGIRAAAEARRRVPGLPVMVLSASVEPTFATELLGSGAAGLGYLLKERVGRVAEFLDALERIATGGSVLDPEVVAQLFTRRADVLDRLTDGERRVLALMAEGLGNRAIAARLVVTEAAVHKHVRNIFAKLDLAPSDEADRRVRAVLEYLRATETR
jgi:DNA-binding NarL/FixJ family response regulator